MERETWASPIRVAAGVGTEIDVLRSSRWPPASESLSQRSHRQPPAAPMPTAPPICSRPEPGIDAPIAVRVGRACLPDVPFPRPLSMFLRATVALSETSLSQRSRNADTAIRTRATATPSGGMPCTDTAVLGSHRPNQTPRPSACRNRGTPIAASIRIVDMWQADIDSLPRLSRRNRCTAGLLTELPKLILTISSREQGSYRGALHRNLKRNRFQEDTRLAASRETDFKKTRDSQRQEKPISRRHETRSLKRNRFQEDTRLVASRETDFRKTRDLQPQEKPISRGHQTRSLKRNRFQEDTRLVTSLEIRFMRLGRKQCSPPCRRSTLSGRRSFASWRKASRRQA